jgi:hypothetical protein
MTDKLKKQQVLRDLKQQLLSRFGKSHLDLINLEIYKLINMKNLDQTVSWNCDPILFICRVLLKCLLTFKDN